MGNHFRENIKLAMKPFVALISPILFYASDVWGTDCNGQLEKDPAELVQNKFLIWLLGVNTAIIMRAGLRECMIIILKPNVGTLSSGKP